MQTQASSPGHVLFVDDDPDVLKAAGLLLGRGGLRMSAVQSPAEAWSVMAADPVDVVLLDLNFTRGATSGEEGFRHLDEVLRQDADAVVVVVTGHSGVNIAVAAMRAGASDFVMKPWRNDRLLATVEGALALRRRRRSLAAGAIGADAPAGHDAEAAPILGEAEAIERLRELVRRAAPTDAAVLIYGGAGTGKSLIARTLHQQSPRAQGPFVTVGLADLSAAEAEAALFGDGGRQGALGDARGGVLVLDEIGALAPALQARLLRVLQTGRVERSAPRLDLRLISTSRRGRDALRGRGGLSDDLLYQLNTVELVAPPLRERGEDALLLANHFLRLYALRYRRPLKPLSEAAAWAVIHAPWPGEVRALRLAMERCVIFSETDSYGLGDLSLEEGAPHASAGAAASGAAASGAPLNLAAAERAMIAGALKQNSFNVSHAARQLGLTRAALYRRMAKHGL